MNITITPRIRISIDQELKESYGQEIYWTWRLILSGIGYAWEELGPEESECDILYSTASSTCKNCLLHIRAQPEFWRRQSDLAFKTTGQNNGLLFPRYEGDTEAQNDILVHRDGCLFCARDLVFDIFWLATGQREKSLPHNKHGHYDLTYAPEVEKNALRLALASGVCAELANWLLDQGLPKPVPRWPNGKKAAACIGHDVDYPEVLRWLEPVRILLRQGLRGVAPAASVAIGKRTHWHFDSWVHAERKLGARSAFYFVARKGSLIQYACGVPDPFYDVGSPRFRDVFKFLADEGFEVGLHASYLAYQNREKFAAEKSRIEEISQQEIAGNRHHYWHIDPDDSDTTLLLHEEVGFKYDASLTHERYLGWRRGLCWPFFPFHREKRRQVATLQLPTGWMDDQLFGYKGDNAGNDRELLSGLANKVVGQGGCLMIDVHDYVYDEVLFPGWASAYLGLLEDLASRQEIWIDTPSNIAAHWTERYNLIVQASKGVN